MPDDEAGEKPVPDVVAYGENDGVRQYVVPLHKLDGALGRIWNGHGDANLSDLTPRDPRNVGVAGGYPQVNTGIVPVNPLMLRRLYGRSAAAMILVDRISADTWGEWLDLKTEDEDLKERLESFFRNPTNHPGERPLWWWCEQSDRCARRDKRSILYFGLADNTGDAAAEPKGVRGVRYLQVIPANAILKAKLDDDETSKTYRQVVAWELAPGNKSKLPAVLHADRCVAFVPRPFVEDDLNDGSSVLEPAINYIEWKENLNWSSAEAYFQYAAPFVVVKQDPNVVMNAQDKAAVKAQVQQMQQGLVQRIFVKGVTIEPLAEGTRLPDPTPHHDIAMQNLAMILGVPKSMLTGDAAGELAASMEDSRRYASRISKLQETYADPIMRAIIDRLLRWGIKDWQMPTKPEVDFSWHPVNESSIEQIGREQKGLAEARQVYWTNNMPLPVELTYEPGEWPDDAVPPDPLALAHAKAAANPAPFQGDPFQKPAAGPNKNPEPAAPGGKLMEQSPGATSQGDAVAPKPLVGAIEATAANVRAALRDAYHAAAKRITHGDTHALVEAAAAFQSRVKELLAAAAAPGLRSATVIGAEGIRDALGPGHVRGMRRDSRRWWSSKQDAGETLDPFASGYVFRTLPPDLAADVAQRLSDRLHDSVLEGIMAGEGVAKLQERLRQQVELSGVDAERIARTEAIRAYNQGAANALKDAGYTEFTFQALPGADPECDDRDGETFSVDDFGNRPPIHPNCRCAMRATLPGEDGDGVVLVRGVTLDGVVAYVAERA